MAILCALELKINGKEQWKIQSNKKSRSWRNSKFLLWFFSKDDFSSNIIISTTYILQKSPIVTVKISVMWGLFVINFHLKFFLLHLFKVYPSLYALWQLQIWLLGLLVLHPRDQHDWVLRTLWSFLIAVSDGCIPYFASAVLTAM